MWHVCPKPPTSHPSGKVILTLPWEDAKRGGVWEQPQDRAQQGCGVFIPEDSRTHLGISLGQSGGRPSAWSRAGWRCKLSVPTESFLGLYSSPILSKTHLDPCPSHLFPATQALPEGFLLPISHPALQSYISPFPHLWAALLQALSTSKLLFKGVSKQAGCTTSASVYRDTDWSLLFPSILSPFPLGEAEVTQAWGFQPCHTDLKLSPSTVTSWDAVPTHALVVSALK